MLDHFIRPIDVVTTSFNEVLFLIASLSLSPRSQQLDCCIVLDHFSRPVSAITTSLNEVLCLTTLLGPLAWSPTQSNYYQFLTVMLPEVLQITKLDMQGQQNTKRFVSEFLLHYSTDGDSWMLYRDASGKEKVMICSCTSPRMSMT